jgi:hypothetical protein
MKKLWALLKNHFAEDFSWPYYLSLMTFLAAGIILNYYLKIETRIDLYNGKPVRILFYFALYGVAYFGGFALMVLFRKQQGLMKSKPFWLLALAGLLILSFDSGFPFLTQLLEWWDADIHLYTWTYSVAVNAISVLLVGIPLLLVYRLVPLSRGNGYGLLTPGYNVKPYFMLLLLMVPVITAASFTPEFVDYYPTYKPSSFAEVLHTPKWLPMAVYEFFYGLDFFNLELLFRGFLVIGLSQVLGKNAIVPMVTTYCFLHFGKPIGEQISSIIGGYILGVIAFYTRGIWGGVIIHIGIGWLMELAAYLQKI